MTAKDDQIRLTDLPEWQQISRLKVPRHPKSFEPEFVDEEAEWIYGQIFPNVGPLLSCSIAWNSEYLQINVLCE